MSPNDVPDSSNDLHSLLTTYAGLFHASSDEKELIVQRVLQSLRRNPHFNVVPIDERAIFLMMHRLVRGRSD